MSDPLLFVDTSEGKVGVGTGSPGNSLHIYKAAAEGTSGLLIEKASGGAGTTAALFFGVSAPSETTNAGIPKAAIFYERNLVNGRGDIKFCNDEVNDANAVTTEAADTRMIIKNNGNVGVGTNTPDYQLDVHGSTAFDGSTTVRILNPASQYGRTQLHLVGRYEASNDGWNASTPRNAIMFKSQSSLNSAITNQWTIQSFPSSNDLGFLSGTNNTPRVIFRGSNGYVGIGDSDPESILHVQSDIAGSSSSIKKTAATASTSEYNYILNGPRAGTTSGGAVHFINGSGRSTDGGTSTYTMRNDSGNTRVGKVSTSTIIAGYPSYPDRPFAMVGKNNGRTYSGSYMIFNSQAYNDQGIYNSSNGRFTAPVAGYYMFTASFLSGEREYQTNTRWHLNGGEIAWGAAHYNFGSGINVNTTSCRPALSCHMIYYMNSGNYMNLKIVGGSMYGAYTGHSTVTCMYMGAK